MASPMVYTPAAYKEVVDAVFTPNPPLPCTPMTGGAMGNVSGMETQPLCVVKIRPGWDAGEDQGGAERSAAIAPPEQVTLRMVDWEKRDMEGHPFGVQGYPYLTGSTLDLDHVLPPEASSVLGPTIPALHRRLREVTSRSDRVIPPVDPVLRGRLSRLEEYALQERGYRLLEPARYRELPSQEAHSVIAFDLNPSTILVDSRAAGWKVRTVDRAFLSGRAVMQPARLFAAWLMVLPGEGFPREEVLDAWPEPLNPREVVLRMQPWFLLMGAEKEDLLATHRSSEAARLRAWGDLLVRYPEMGWGELEQGGRSLGRWLS